MPLNPLNVQIHNKLIYNLKRIDIKQYDFYTIGYEKTDIHMFIERLKSKGVKTLVDVRKNPFSYIPDFCKEALQSALKGAKIEYWHVPELGVDKQLREKLDSDEDYENLWKWYDRNIIPAKKMLDNDESVLENILRLFDESNAHPAAFMCMEFEPTKCHRHRIAKSLESTKGMRSIDL
jgi:uncharacterized protein (DUF488 family)